MVERVEDRLRGTSWNIGTPGVEILRGPNIGTPGVETLRGPNIGTPGVEILRGSLVCVIVSVSEWDVWRLAPLQPQLDITGDKRFLVGTGGDHVTATLGHVTSWLSHVTSWLD